MWPSRIGLAACLACVLPAHALPEKFIDEQDGQLDLSNYLLRHRGVLPVPIIITEPAVGYGFGMAAVYFSQSFEERAEASRAAGEPVIPPDIAVGAGMKTENGTWALGARWLAVEQRQRDHRGRDDCAKSDERHPPSAPAPACATRRPERCSADRRARPYRPRGR